MSEWEVSAGVHAYMYEYLWADACMYEYLCADGVHACMYEYLCADGVHACMYEYLCVDGGRSRNLAFTAFHHEMKIMLECTGVYVYVYVYVHVCVCVCAYGRSVCVCVCGNEGTYQSHGTSAW